MTEYSEWAKAKQGIDKKVLCVCLAGLLRSPTAAWILSNPPYNFNTRSCGAEGSIALVPITQRLINWADEIVCMNTDIYEFIKGLSKPVTAPIINLQITDTYAFREPELIQLIKERYNEAIS